MHRALTTLIALGDPLDQYFMRHPRDLFGRPHAHALIDPSNPYILEMHLPCALQKVPPREINDVRVVQAMAHKQDGGALVSHGAVRVTQRVIGYRRLSLGVDRPQQFREEVLSVEDLALPTQTFDTVALWREVPLSILAQVKRRRLDPAGGLHAMEHAAIGLLPLFAMCDRWDIGGLSTPHHPDTETDSVFIYDAFPGGVGITEKGFDLLADLWRATYKAVRDCPCEDGCPSCVQVSINNRQTPEHKGLVLTGRLVLGR